MEFPYASRAGWAHNQSTRGEAMATSPESDRLRVLVASDHTLVADAVRVSLASRGHEVAVVRWPGGARRVPKQRRPPPPVDRAAVGLLLAELDRWTQVQAATSVVEGIRVPWVALTASPRGPAWGALLVAGVEIILPSDSGLADVSDRLLAVARREAATPPDERAELETAWRETIARHQDVIEQIGLLSPREREVLDLMYEGSSVAVIAERFKVSQATVRSQVKVVLRKLDVNTQLAAVAALDDALGLQTYRRPQPADPPPRR